MIITVSGKAEAGKDTFANFLKAEFERQNVSCKIVHYADYLKFVCEKYFDWNGEKDEAGRALLQEVGTDLIRKKKPDFWAKIVFELVCVLENQYDVFIIPDTRFPNEIEMFKESKFAVETIQVLRPDHISKLTEEQQNHISETSLDTYHFDTYIQNDGTLYEFRELAVELVFILTGKGDKKNARIIHY